MNRQQFDPRTQAASAEMSGDISSQRGQQQFAASSSHSGVQLYNPAQFTGVNDKQDITHPTMPHSQQEYQESQQPFFNQQSELFYYQDGAHVTGQQTDNVLNGQQEWYNADPRHCQPVSHGVWQHEQQQSTFPSNTDPQFQGQIHRSFSDVWNNWDPAEQTRTLPNTVADTFRPEGHEGAPNKPEHEPWQYNAYSYSQSDYHNFPHVYNHDNTYDGFKQDDPAQGFAPIPQANYSGAVQEDSSFEDYGERTEESSAVFGVGGEEVEGDEEEDKTDKNVTVDGDGAPQGWDGDRPRPPLLRADSWISNSSLLTYNRSMTGSQDMLNSLSSLPYGEEGAGGFYQHAFGERHSSLPQVERLTLSEHFTRKRSVSPLALGEPSRLPNADGATTTRKTSTVDKCDSILSQIGDSNEQISTEAARNKPVADAKLHSSETDMGNVEVLAPALFAKPIASPLEADVRPKPNLGVIGHREGSPFKAVIQHEVAPCSGPKPELLPICTNNMGANLESTPDNVEHPVDVDVAIPPSHAAHLNPRQRSRDLQGNSPTATLWQNPEPTKAFNVVIAPAGSIVPQHQSVIVVGTPFANQAGAPISNQPSPPAKPQTAKPAEVEISNEPAQLAPVVQQEPANMQIASQKSVTQPAKVQPPDEVGAVEVVQSQQTAFGKPVDREMTASHADSHHRPQREHNYDSRQHLRDDRADSGRISRDHDRRSSFSQGQDADYDDRGRRRKAYRDDHQRERWDRDHYERPLDQDPYYPRSDHERPRDRPHTPAGVVGALQEPFQNQRERYPSPVRFSRHSRDHGDPSRRTPDRPYSRDGSESDHGSARNYAAPHYDPYRAAAGPYARDPRYQAAYDYSWYSRQQQYYSDPYYSNPYNYGYYAEMYGADPRYANYYGAVPSMATSGYHPYYAYADYERRSLSGRSSVTDEIQQERGRFAEDFHRPSSQPAASMDPSAIYGYDDPSHSQRPSEFVDVPFQHNAESDSSATFVGGSGDRLTPAKFSYPHCRAVLSNNAHLWTVLPNSVLDGQPAVVDIMEMQSAFDADVETLRDFPGPLVRGQTHKNDIINFCTRKLRKTAEDVNLVDRDSQILIWEFLILLIRQNGVVVGTDIAELLVKSKPEAYDNLTKSGHNEDDGVGVSKETLPHDSATEKFRELLLYGRRKDALEWAVNHGLWGHALVLASKMDNKTYAYILTRFTNSFAKNDPLQTLYQLMAGRQPAAVTCVADERWGNWRSHLAMILSNTSQHPEVDRKSIVTLGDTLAARGCIHAAHFCYIVAEIDIGHFSRKSSKFVLVGTNHGLPFEKFASNEAIQCTELFEYAQSLSNKEFTLPAFQPYKFLYATRLAEVGLCQEALQYCEVIESTMFKAQYSSNYTLIKQIYELGDKLKYNDSAQLAMNRGEMDDQCDPQWLTKLKEFIESSSDVSMVARESESVNDESYNVNAESQYSIESAVLLPPASDIGLQHQYPVITSPPQQTNWTGVGDLGDYNEADITQYNNNRSLDHHQYTQQYDEGSQKETEQSSTATSSAAPQSNHYQVPQPLANNYSPQRTERFDYRRTPNTDANFKGLSSQGVVQPTPQSAAKTPNGSTKVTDTKKKSESQTSQRKQGGGWLGGIFSKLSLRGKNQMILPDDKNPTIVWDAATGSWLNTEAGEDEGEAAPAAPPTDMQLNPNTSPTTPNFTNNSNSIANVLGNTESTATGYKLHGGKAMRKNYVDVLAGKTAATKSMPPNLFQNVESLSTASVPQFFIPSPVNVAGGDEDAGMVDFVTRATQPQVGNPRSRPSSPSDDTETEEKQEPQAPQAPMMFDPETTQRAKMMMAPPVKSGLGRYGRYPK